jgi:lipoprotein NlpI
MILTGRGEWERTGRTFLQTDHRYVPYVAIMLYSYKAGSGAAKDEALKILRRHWEKADRSTWAMRARQADPRVWREMLLGYFIGKVDRARIFDLLADEDRFRESYLRHLPFSRGSLTCEAYFYDALLARSRGEFDRMEGCLRRVTEEGNPSYFEYSIARFLLADLAGRKGGGYHE